MQQSQTIIGQPPAVVCLVEDFVGNLCPWCQAVLKPSRTKPRKYCSEAHEKAFKRTTSKRERQVAIQKLNRDKSIGFDGQYTGPANTPLTGYSKVLRDAIKGQGCARPAREVQSNLGVVTQPPEPTPHRETRRYVQPVIELPAEEKLVRKIFSSRS
jgi:hypothetical protein